MCCRASLGFVLVLVLSGCSGDEPEPADNQATSHSTEPAHEAPDDAPQDADGEAGAEESQASTDEAATVVAVEDLPKAVVPFDDSIEFLYTGADAVQEKVAAGSIDSGRAAVLRGRVSALDGSPLADVEVCILNHPELGRTRTGDDGAFDLVVNGGGQLIVCYDKDGLLPIQRSVQVPWGQFTWLPDVTLVPEDSQVSEIDLTTNVMQVARGSQVEDVDGQRQGTLLLPPGTTAEMVLPDGTTQPLEQLSMRITEYTVGEDGPAAMPATLPPASGYTYCFELSVEEATAAGSDHVVFNKPVFHYVENFLGFPVGSPVPVGYYNRDQGVWEPSDNGIIVQVLAVNDGLAELDVDGGGSAASAERMQALSMTDEERRQLAAMYEPGQSLWRVPIPHCTDPIDCNWPFGLGDDAVPPEPPPSQDPNWDPCYSAWYSSIDIQNQSLLEAIDIAGTSMQLHYHSARVRGRQASYTLEIPLSGESIPESLKRIELEINIAGQQVRETLTPEPNLHRSFTWDGRDAYGRMLQGSRMARVRIGYAYEAVYMEPADYEQSFARFSDTPIEASRARQEYVFWQERTIPLGTWDALGHQLGGWTLTELHAYDPVSGVVYLGSGEQYRARNVGNVIETVAGSGTGGAFDLAQFFDDDGGFEGDGGPATAARLNDPASIAFGPDGALYIADTQNHRIRRVDANGVIETVVGTENGSGNLGDGGPAIDALLNNPTAIAFGPDGSLYIADAGNSQYDEVTTRLQDGTEVVRSAGVLRIRRVTPDGIITTIAGGGEEIPGDGGPATSARLGDPGFGFPRQRLLKPTSGLVVDAEGVVYFTDFYGGLRRVDQQGVIGTVVTGLQGPRGITLLLDGSFYVAEWYGHAVRRIGLDGSNTIVAGTGVEGQATDGLLGLESPLSYPCAIAVDRDGSLFIAEQAEDALENDGRGVRVMRADGVLITFAGSPTAGFGGDGGPAIEAQLLGPGGLAIGPDGNLYICDTGNHRIRRVRGTLAGTGDDLIAIPSPQGDELFEFDHQGRHLRTIDAISGQVIYEFQYDDQQLLTSVRDAYGNVLSIERSAAGEPQAFIAPSGARTELQTGNGGFLNSVSVADGRTTGLSYAQGAGLLTELSDANGNLHHYSYDAQGRLVSDEDPAGGFIELSRTASGNSFEVTTRSAMEHQQSYRVINTPEGAQQTVNRDMSGAETTSLRSSDGSRTVTRPDGTQMIWTMGPDPRWGMQSPLVTEWNLITPGGREYTIENRLDAELSDPADALTLRSLTNTRTINGRIYKATMDLENGTLVFTSPEGREITLSVEEDGTVREAWAAGIEPVISEFDDMGRISTLQGGGLTVDYTYDEAGRLASMNNSAGQQVQFAYDHMGRLASMVAPGGQSYGLTYDSAGLWTDIRMPNGAMHRLTYTPIGLNSGYVLPGGTAYSATYDVDRRATSLTLPGGRKLENSYDEAGRWVGQTYPEAIINMSYSDNGAACCGADPPADLTWTPSEGPAQEMRLEFDGPLLLGLEYRGAATGRYQYRYDENLWVAGVKLDDGIELTLVRDADGLVTGFGPFSVSRDAPTGLPKQISDGRLDVQIEHDALGRIASRTHSIAGVEVYRLALEYDAAGRVSERVEAVFGESHVDQFSYDVDSQLVSIARDGQLIEEYAYDSNGNRVNRRVGAAQASASYDEQDRLLAQGNVDYEFNEDGFLASRGDDRFTYSARGELLAVNLADGTSLSYSYDALGRCVARTDPVGTIQFLYGNPGEPFQVTASRDPFGELTVYHYETGGTLFAMQRGDEWFYVASDQVGTPRIVCNDAGQIVRQVDYSAFGEIVSYSGEDFALPIGFGGGISDPSTGLARFGFRDYDPAAGRWMARDPLLFASGQPNFFAYVGNDPVNSVDPSGLINWSFTGGGWGYGQNFWDFGMSPNAWECISNFFAGFGDGISQGLTGVGGFALGLGWNPINFTGGARDMLGGDSGQVNRNSTTYYGGRGAGAAIGAATVLVAAAEGGGGRGSGVIPQSPHPTGGGGPFHPGAGGSRGPLGFPISNNRPVVRPGGTRPPSGNVPGANDWYEKFPNWWTPRPVPRR